MLRTLAYAALLVVCTVVGLSCGGSTHHYHDYSPTPSYESSSSGSSANEGASDSSSSSLAMSGTGSSEDRANCRERVLNLKDRLETLEKQKADNKKSTDDCSKAAIGAGSEPGAVVCPVLGGTNNILIDTQIGEVKEELFHWQARCGE
jgi:hypothetical protein